MLITLGEDTIKKNIQALLQVSRETGLEENTEKIKLVVVSQHQSVELLINPLKI
jgi:hypothetical protein